MDGKRDREYLASQKSISQQAKIADLTSQVVSLTKSLAEARVAREVDTLKLKALEGLAGKATFLERTCKELEFRLKAKEEECTELKVENGSLNEELRAMRESNRRLTEMVAHSAEFAIVAKSAGGVDDPAIIGTEDIRYLKGAGGIGKQDLKKAIQQGTANRESLKDKNKQYHWTYKFWSQLSAQGRLEEEDMLWSPERAVEIVKAYDAGKYSKDKDLAVEKLLFEVDSSN